MSYEDARTSRLGFIQSLHVSGCGNAGYAMEEVKAVRRSFN
jgi:hypothetical protein